MKQKLSITLWVVLTLITFFPRELKACTGITLRAKDGSRIVARTIEWGGSNLNMLSYQEDINNNPTFPAAQQKG